MGKLQDKRNHRFAHENLSAYLDNELSERDNRRVRAHLDSCGLCRQELEALQATTLALSELSPMPLPRSFAIPRQAVAEQQRVRRLDRGFAALRTAGVAITVTLVMLVSGDQLLARDVISTPMMQAARQEDMVAMAESDRSPYEFAQPEAAREPDDEKASEADVEALAMPEAAPDMAGDEELTPEERAARDAAPPGLGEGELPRQLVPMDDPSAAPDDEGVMVMALPEDLTQEEITAAARAPESLADQTVPERIAALEPVDQAAPIRNALRQAMTVLGGAGVVVLGGLFWLGRKRRL
jgi:anti-sigma factor RsiW